MISQKLSLAILVGAAILIVVVVALLNPIPQSQSYHHFADQRSWLGIPNTWNVLSNIPFALVGIWGLFLLLSNEKVKFVDPRERWFWIVISIGLILTAIGSGYYHLAPDDSKLFWDRGAMAIVFMSLVAALIGERISMNLGLWLWPLLLAIGLYTAMLSSSNVLNANSDLRFYLGVQLFTIIVILVMLLSPSPYDRSWDLAVVLICYLLALTLDFSDHQVYRLAGENVSGHTLKHLAAAFAGAWLILMIWKRKKREQG